MQRLKQHYTITYRQIEKMSRREALQAYTEADIIIDQVCGAYGNLSVEGMALGKAVVCYLRDDLKPHNPDLPVISANPDTLYVELEKLLKDPDRVRNSAGWDVPMPKNTTKPAPSQTGCTKFTWMSYQNNCT
ncbi:hypothetical protein CR205_02900 [Alteribacter lacisalsi]|uniref:Uncharacterized protein n=1 Tax=Alteribacter lacisalsi TaxID=2045244 RepID=A0A2W0HC38_9BACI|nr:hypothetical protein [Alteribacter lacisalsi]PYZ97560.1 hypothetical protein CR205_02900 [Alteribacter lacisalsi]